MYMNRFIDPLSTPAIRYRFKPTSRRAKRTWRWYIFCKKDAIAMEKTWQRLCMISPYRDLDTLNFN